MSRFAQLAKRDLRGALTLTAALSGAPSKGNIKAVLDGAVNAPGAGLAAIDGLLGRKLGLSGAVETLPGGVSFDALTINGEFVQARVNGAATQEKADIGAQIILPDLHRADARLTGRANIDAKISGSLQKPDASLDVAVVDGGANGRPIPKLNLHARAQDLWGLSSRAPRLTERRTDARCADELTRPARERAGRSTPWTSASAARA